MYIACTSLMFLYVHAMCIVALWKVKRNRHITRVESMVYWVFFERLHFVNWVKNRNEPLCICTCIMVIDNCRVIRRTFAFLLFKFLQGLILLVQECTVSTHPPTTLKK